MSDPKPIQKVRAKFYVTEILHSSGMNQKRGQPSSEPAATIKLAPAYGTGNEVWSKYTPAGELRMTVTNPAAIDFFALGDAYYLDFTPVEE